MWAGERIWNPEKGKRRNSNEFCHGITVNEQFLKKREGSKMTFEGRKVSAKGWWVWKQRQCSLMWKVGWGKLGQGLGYLLERLGWWKFVFSLSCGKNLTVLTQSRERVSREELWNSGVNRNSSPESFPLPSIPLA